MLIGCVVEGETEYYCVPSMLAKLGHSSLRPLIAGNGQGDWEQVIERRILPRVKSLALKNPHKILVLLDREHRRECPPELASRAMTTAGRELQHCGLACPVVFVISDLYFECTLFADYDAVDRLDILARPLSPAFQGTTDGKNVLGLIKTVLRTGTTYHKTKHGPILASGLRLEDQRVLQHSRALRKFVAELPRDYPVDDLF